MRPGAGILRRGGPIGALVRLLLVVLVLGIGAGAAPLAAQQTQPEDGTEETFPTGTPVPAVPQVLVVNLERVFAESMFGERVRDDLGAAQAELIAENDRIQAELQTEERSLAERRATMEVDAFRAAADAFDTRVQEIRREQDAKEVALQQVVEAGRAEFRAAVEPVIARLMVERGAVLVLYHTSVYVAVAAVDITDESIAALDEAVGDGRSPGAATPDDSDPDAAATPLATPDDGVAPDDNAAPAPDTGTAPSSP